MSTVEHINAGGAICLLLLNTGSTDYYLVISHSHPVDP